MKIAVISLRLSLRIAASAAAALSLAACTGIWGDLDNPIDPFASSYQGYTIVGDASQIEAANPSDGASNGGVSLRFSRVLGATNYGVKIASSLSGLDTAEVHSYTTNDVSIEEYTSVVWLNDTKYYWTVTSSGDNGVTWGNYSKVYSFTSAWTAVAPAPTFSLPSGTYSGAQSVELHATYGSAKILYTTDGSTPTAASKEYLAVINVSSSMTIRAVIYAAGLAACPEGSATYTIN